VTWVEDFLGGGPDYAAEERSVLDVETLFFHAGVGAGLPLEHAQDFAGMSAQLMCDPQLFAMAVAALEGPHFSVHFEGTVDHAVIDDARIAMAAPVMVGAFVGGASRVVLHGLDWPELLWPILLRAEQVYGIKFEVSRMDAKTVMVSRATKGLPPLGERQPTPLEPLTHLELMVRKAS
jgi:hypothetical protein